MSPTHKSSHTREDEEERTGAGTPGDALDPEERTVGSRLDEEGEDDERDIDEDDVTEEIDLDALPAMEGPDA